MSIKSDEVVDFRKHMHEMCERTARDRDSEVMHANELVSWCLTSIFSTNIWLYQGQKVRGGELSPPSIGRPAIY